MKTPHLRLGCFLFLCATLSGLAQSADFERARSFHALTENKVYRDRVQAHWLAGNTRFWYQLQTGAQTHQFILVDAEKGAKELAFDHERLARALVAVGVKDAVADRLSLEELAFNFAENTLRLRAAGTNWICNLKTYALREGEPAKELPARSLEDAPRASARTGPETSLTFVNQSGNEVELFWLSTEGERRSYGKLRPGERRTQHTFAGHVWMALDPQGKPLLVYEAQDEGGVAEITATPSGRFQARRRSARHPQGGGNSPDGQWRAFIQDHNVRLKQIPSGSEIALSSDGTPEDSYSEPVFWSPDSKKLVAVRTQKGDEDKVYLVESSPKDQLQPKLHSFDYLKAGDRVPIDKPRLFDVVAAKPIAISDSLFDNPWSVSEVRWQPDSARFTFIYNQRGHQVLRVVGVDAQTGRACPVIEEKSDTFIDYSGKFFAEYLDDTSEIIWMSERDGWNHLYLYDAAAGRVKNQITKGNWVVRGVDRVDKEKRQIWFRASGLFAAQDPYYIHYCRVNWDGSGLVTLTQGDGTHSIDCSPDGRFIIDTYSRADLPPVNELRRASDGQLIRELERADWSALLAAGWRAPERFAAKGRDGQTEIYGLISAPSKLDPAKRYPVIENIYAGPQDSFVPKSFSAFNSMQELAELGFVVVQIDGMGTANRSKKFHDVCWKNLVDGGFPDRILWMKAAAAQRPWMDLERVGIYGTSAGGQNALAALLTHGEFYKAGVADCGCHDNRMDKIWWNEQWMGWPVGPHYEAQSNVTLAHQLQGKLFLMVGEMDRNVDPASTLQVVDALIKADKNFDLLVMPGAGHGVAGTPYGKKRLQEFFVKSLL